MSLKFKVFANCLDGDYADKTNVRLRRFYTKMSDEKIDAFIDKSLNKFGTRLMRVIEECEGEKIPGAKKEIEWQVQYWNLCGCFREMKNGPKKLYNLLPKI